MLFRSVTGPELQRPLGKRHFFFGSFIRELVIVDLQIVVSEEIDVPARNLSCQLLLLQLAPAILDSKMPVATKNSKCADKSRVL